MIPHSYTVDSLSQSQELASKILSSSTPQQILSACSSIESFVHSHSSDHSRHFFSISFPTLILKLFGFANESSSATSPPQSNGWIDVISSSNDPDLAARVFHLLSPNGVIFSSMQAVDRKSLVKFVFPTERLPEWARYMLSTEKDVKILSNLCPIFKELDEVFSGSSKNERKDDSQPQACGYSSAWQGYVLSNYLYYSSLVMHFIGFAHKFLHTDPEVIVQMVLKVMNVLTSSKELIDLVKNVDTVFHSKQAGSSKSKLNGLYRFVPSIREQLQDWEDGLCESDADGSFLHENWNKDLRLFSHGEDGGQQLLQLFILRAEAELQAISGGNLAQNLQRVDSLKSHISCFFGGYAIKPIPFSLEVEQQSRDEIFRPKRVGNHALADIKYKGDWMKRPISDDEVAWLAKLLIWLSDWLNKSLRLNQPASSVVGPKWSYVEVSGENEGKVYGPTETMKTVLYAIRSLLLMLVVASVKLMRKHGVRINLRMFASKKIVAVFILFAVFSILKKAFGLFVRA
ncbi:hypothetical protein ACOSP7_025487 [Xanthoceras sorbifolium]